MKVLLNTVGIKVNESIYLKDPQTSELGKNILTHSIDMIHDLGFEQFTFKKLGAVIGSNESSIYRYFENKHKLLLYLSSWYWSWLEYKLVFGTTNMKDATDKLRKAILILTEAVEEDNEISFINEQKLNQIVISESSKAYLNKSVDVENKEGAFLGFKQLVSRVGEMILEINDHYPYSNMIVSTVLEGAHLQRFYAEHLPKLTNTIDGEDAVVNFYTHMVINTIKNFK